MYDPERYEDNKSSVNKDIAEYVPALVKGMTWKNNETILDFGCGAGSVGYKHFLPQAIQHDSKIYAVDISNDMLAHARQNFPSPLIEYMQGDITADNFPLLNKQVDKIFSIYVLHFVKDYKKALRAFYQMLKPGGQIGFTVITKSCLFRVYQILQKDPKWATLMKGIEEFIPAWFEDGQKAEECFKEAMTKIGFNNIEVKTHVRKFCYKFETKIELFCSLNPFIARFPNDLLNDFKAEYRRLIADYYKINQNSEFVPGVYEMIYCTAEKTEDANPQITH